MKKNTTIYLVVVGRQVVSKQEPEIQIFAVQFYSFKVHECENIYNIFAGLINNAKESKYVYISMYKIGFQNFFTMWNINIRAILTLHMAYLLNGEQYQSSQKKILL